MTIRFATRPAAKPRTRTYRIRQVRGSARARVPGRLTVTVPAGAPSHLKKRRPGSAKFTLVASNRHGRSSSAVTLRRVRPDRSGAVDARNGMG